MKPAPFVYHAPDSVDEALELLASGDAIRVLAGGQSLVQLMNFRLAKPSALVDINGLPGLDGIEERDGELHLGTLVRQQTLIDDGTVARLCPLLREAARYVGYRATRHRGTLGGSLAFAAPWAELTAAAVALDATIEARSARGPRSIPARSFFQGPNRTSLQPDELLTGMRVPTAQPRTGAAFEEVSARYRDYAQVAAGAIVTLDDTGNCTSAELVLLRVADAPYRADVSQAVGSRLDDRTLEAVSASLAALDPPDDIEVSGEYRRRVAPVLAWRALAKAAGRARQAEAA